MEVSRTAPEKVVLGRFAEEIAKRIARRTIFSLQSIKDTLSGDDSQLANAWDEICVQVQADLSMFWDVYDDTARSFVDSFVKELKAHEKAALWFQTDQGWDWLYDLDVDLDDVPPVLDDQIVDWILRDYVYRNAGGWSNERIRAYLDL